MSGNIPKNLLEFLAASQELWGLSYSQMANYLYKYHQIKITPQGLRAALLRDLPGYQHKKNTLQNDN